MNEQILNGKWYQMSGAIREKWGELTEDDVTIFLGKGEQLVGRLQEQYGYSREQAEREVADFLASFQEETPLSDVRDKSTEVVREHPWFASFFFGAMVLLVASYVLNRFVSIGEISKEHISS